MFAPEFCLPGSVEECHEIRRAHGGTLRYIADVTKAIREARKL